MNSNQEKSQDVGWNFPPTGGGVQDGWNNPGAAHFKGNRLHHLAREIIQNSLDARKNLDAPVSVTFEVKNVDRTAVPGVEELITHIDACIVECQKEKDSASLKELEQAKETFQNETITFLKIYDSNTTGLEGNHWNALVKGSGTSIKSDDTAGGSHGIGKNAAFVISSARTVYYWTAFKPKANSSELVEKFQGKSMLMHHKIDGEERHGIGFWGHRKNCLELVEHPLPNEFRVTDLQQKPIQGSAIWIAGFRVEAGWQDQIAGIVIENYFHAISSNMLKVVLEPESENENLLEINATTLDTWLDALEDGIPEITRNTRIYLKFLKNPSSAIEIDDEDLEICKLWVEMGENYPRHVALVRNSGMLITTEQQKTTRIRTSGQEFIALCLFESQEGNKLLRKMENPQHDHFSSDFLPEDQRELGKKVLDRITKWIRDSVREYAVQNKEAESHQLNELARYLPLNYSEGPLDLDGKGEKSFGDYGKIETRPIKIKTYSSPHSFSGNENDSSGDDSDDEYVEPGGRRRGSTGGGEHKRPPVRESFTISDVRVVEIDKENKDGEKRLYRVSFIPNESAIVNLQFLIAGDRETEVRNSVKAVKFSKHGKRIYEDLSTYSVTKNSRFGMFISDSSPIENSAWIIRANSIIGSETD